MCRFLLAQTSTTPHTRAHRHRVRRSCAWSLETNWSRREPRSEEATAKTSVEGFFCCWKCTDQKQLANVWQRNRDLGVYSY
ncbi:hypothetical protein ACB092_12G084600 [Castanea dentata]